MAPKHHALRSIDLEGTTRALLTILLVLAAAAAIFAGIRIWRFVQDEFRRKGKLGGIAG
jgi:hypothetical protein